MMKVKLNFFKKHPLLKDALGLVLFVILVVFGTILLNRFVFRSYTVVGVSMENTLHGEDRVIINRMAVTWSHFLGKEYLPERGQIIVFANGDSYGPLKCDAEDGAFDQYIIKRVIAFPGERVIVRDGVLKVYSDSVPDGFEPDVSTRVDDNNGPKKFTDGEVDMVVPEGEIFVAGDNREDSANSRDSRNGLGTVPLCRVIGPAVLRLWPLNKVRLF